MYTKFSIIVQLGGGELGELWVTYRSQKNSKIKIRTSSANKYHRALVANEVRVLIFDDPAEEKQAQRPCSGFSPARVLLFANITIAKYELVTFLNNKF
jgi:hypothetical protein